MVAWMRQLEDEEGLSPLWEVFFQIAAYPVPQVRGANMFSDPDMCAFKPACILSLIRTPTSATWATASSPPTTRPQGPDCLGSRMHALCQHW